MATLTAADKNHIRKQSGDTCADDYDVDDEYMQWIHDNLASSEPLCISSIPLGGTIVWVLRARLARAIPLFDEDGDGGSRSVSQKYDHIEKMLKEWESRCGMSGGAITIGTLDLGLDWDGTESEYASLPGYWWMGYFR